MIEISLEGKSAVVTGASQGLGASIVRRLHEAGAFIVVNYFPDAMGGNKENAQALANSLGSRVALLAGDVRRLEDMERLAEFATTEFGGLDIAVNNAGILRDRTLKKMTGEEWQSVVDTNLTGVFNVVRTAANCLRDNGRIVSIASISGFAGFFGQGNYAAAKAGVVGLTRTASRELAYRAITVNAVAPGVVMTDMGHSIPSSVRNEMLNSIPLRRFGEPEEIADTVVFLCSPMASYMTGQVLHVNGGWIG